MAVTRQHINNLYESSCLMWHNTLKQVYSQWINKYPVHYISIGSCLSVKSFYVCDARGKDIAKLMLQNASAHIDQFKFYQKMPINKVSILVLLIVMLPFLKFCFRR